MDNTFIIKTICDFVSNMNASIYGKTWSFIGFSFYQPWFYIIFTIIILWIIYEIFSTGKSVNGFSGNFNRFIGAGLYFFISSLLFYIPDLLSFGAISCFYIPIIHLFVFISVKLILLRVGFWHY